VNPVSVGEVTAARERITVLSQEVARCFVGSSRPLEIMAVALLARGHALLEGVPGVAKTTLVKSFAAALGCATRRIQFTPDLLPADITGTYVFSPKDGTFTLRPGPLFANVVLADEINRAPAKSQSALLEAMQERQVTIEGDRFELPNPFVVLATQNPIDLEGTYPLPEAQIDRFLVRITMTYPSAKDEATMLRTYGTTPPSAQAVMSPAEVVSLQALTDRIHVDPDLTEYAVALTHFTRSHPKVTLGCSPRATLGLMQAGKAFALMEGRPLLTPDDLRAVAPSVLAHRLVLVGELEGNQDARRQVIDEGLAKVTYRRPARAL